MPVAPGVDIGGRFYAAGPLEPTLLYFHGNGEIVADYEELGPLYKERGLNFFPVDYRGYGRSDGTPTGSNLLTDAVSIFEATDKIFADQNLTPTRFYVMGRSLGSASAIEVARYAGSRTDGSLQLDGLIIESGFADTFALIARLGGPTIQADDAKQGFGNASKISQITIPTLIIHGKADFLIPASEGQTLYDRSAATDKQLVLIPGAGHNDLMIVGMEQYFGAINQFVNQGD